MSTSSWDDMKRVREEEFFHKEEQKKLEQIRESRAKMHAAGEEARTQLKAFQRGFSPLTGASMFKANVAGIDVLDCPEEGCLTITYEDLQFLLEKAHLDESGTIKGWTKFLEPIVKEESSDE